MALLLCDLAGADANRRFSPFCWRIRLALAHKELPVETITWRFTEKDAIARSGQKAVPVLVDGEQWIADSWTIANYLEDAYPERPSLFGGDAGRALSRFYITSSDILGGRILPFIVFDILRHLHEKDRAYFRQSREELVGETLEVFAASRKESISTFRDGLAPLRLALKTQPFLGGSQPLYADYTVFGPFQWARCISPFALLAADDPIRLWRDRLLDSFNGLARMAPAYDA